MTSTDQKPLKGWRVLVPRGGPWGDGVAYDLRAQGATPVVAPMINFAATQDAQAWSRRSPTWPRDPSTGSP